MSSPGGFGVPGISAASYTTEREILWGRDDQHLPQLWRNSIISGAARDAGNTPTTLLRRGLILGRVDATGELEEWDADASDGTQNIASVLNKELRAQDFDANNTDRSYATLLMAPVLANQLLIQGTALTSHVDQYLARRQMVDMGFVFDDDPQGFYAGRGSRYAAVTGTTDTLTAAENGSTLFYSNAASVTVTLPALVPGLVFDLVRTADEEFIVASAEGDNMVVGNDLSADSVTFTTAGQQIGARIRLKSIYVVTTLKWIVEFPTMPFGTGLTGGFAYSIAT